MNSSVSVSRLNSRLSGLLLAHVTVLLGYVFSKGLYVHPMQVFVFGFYNSIRPVAGSTHHHHPTAAFVWGRFDDVFIFCV